MRRIVLASTSPFRRALLDRLDAPYDASPPAFEEVAPPGLGPIDCARRFAEGKAQSLAASHPDALILGADQALELDGEMLRKPATLEEAAAQLSRLAGRVHALHSAVALHAPAERRTLSEVTTVTLRMRALEPRQIARYIELERPIGSVGSYLFERRGAWLFDEVTPLDETAIVGLPLLSVCRLLRCFGVDLLGA